MCVCLSAFGGPFVGDRLCGFLVETTCGAPGRPGRGSPSASPERTGHGPDAFHNLDVWKSTWRSTASGLVVPVVKGPLTGGLTRPITG